MQQKGSLLRNAGPLGRAALAAVLALAGCNRATAHPEVHLTLVPDGDFLAFKPDALSVPSGATVVITFHHAGRIISQTHDVVVADPGAMLALLAQSNRAAATADDESKSFIAPGDKRVIAASARIGKGETTTIRFIAPAPGDYPFFCSTPGHADTMRGVLHVTPS